MAEMSVYYTARPDALAAAPRDQGPRIKMNIEELTIKQAREISQFFSASQEKPKNDFMADFIAKSFIGKSVLIRTFSAGVWAGELWKKSGNEVILLSARRLWKWKATTGISLSEVSQFGVVENESRIAAPVPTIWLEAIEIIPMNLLAIESIFGAKNAAP